MLPCVSVNYIFKIIFMKKNSTFCSFFYVSFLFDFIDGKLLCEKVCLLSSRGWLPFVSCTLFIILLQQIPPFHVSSFFLLVYLYSLPCLLASFKPNQTMLSFFPCHLTYMFCSHSYCQDALDAVSSLELSLAQLTTPGHRVDKRSSPCFFLRESVTRIFLLYFGADLKRIYRTFITLPY